MNKCIHGLYNTECSFCLGLPDISIAGADPNQDLFDKIEEMSYGQSYRGQEFCEALWERWSKAEDISTADLEKADALIGSLNESE